MNIKKMYNELIFTSLLLNFLDAFLTAMSVFTIGYFFVYFTRINVYTAVFFSVLFFVRSLIMKIKQNKILLLEKKYPNLQERLRTSYEYQGHSNTVINDLHTDILGYMKKVDVNAFFSSKKVLIKTGIIVGMLSLTLYFSYIGFDSLFIKNSIIKLPIYKEAIAFFADEKRDEIKNREKLESKRLIETGNKNLNISIDTYNTELDIKDISEPEKNDYGGAFPKEIGGAAQEVYEEKIPEEYKDAVKDYFKKINE